MARFISTTWDLWSYDVWGNKRDGYEVNDRSNFGRDVPLRLRLETHNVGTLNEFQSASPTIRQIRKLFGLRYFKLDLDGDDTVVYVNRASDGYPIGEMILTSHRSLSPPSH